jgi:electron transport complex protein RnfD
MHGKSTEVHIESYCMSESVATNNPADKATRTGGDGRRATTAAVTAEAVGFMHSGIGVSRYVAMHALGAVFPLTAGVIFFGWRALGAVVLVLVGATGATLVWQRIGSRGAQLRHDHVMWLALLLAMTLPASLFSGSAVAADGNALPSLWPVLLSAGVILVIFTWLLGGLGAGRVHPVLITHLLLFICFQDALTPGYVLQRKHIMIGDLLAVMPPELRSKDIEKPWLRAPDAANYDSIRRTPASQILLEYTRGADAPTRSWVSLDAVLRDRMPPLEDLIVGGHPAPIGMGSAIAVIIGGLFLLYRGLIDYRVPLLIIIGAIVALLVLPVPVVITERDAVWRWLPMRDADVGWDIGLTLLNYELMSSPLLFTAFFLATSAAVRPIALRARIVYALFIGLLAGAFQFYVSVSIGPYIALLVASLLTPTFDRFFRPRTLV